MAALSRICETSFVILALCGVARPRIFRGALLTVYGVLQHFHLTRRSSSVPHHFSEVELDLRCTARLCLLRKFETQKI
jgi:hypothetical protein